VDKWIDFREGCRCSRYLANVSCDYADTHIIVFGHTHPQTETRVDGQCFFNPGAAYLNNFNPSTAQLV
jgi:predicted phosphodiesterase